MALPDTVASLATTLGLDGKLTSLFYGNEFHAATAENVPVVSPLTGEKLAETGGASEVDVGLVVAVSTTGLH